MGPRPQSAASDSLFNAHFSFNSELPAPQRGKWTVALNFDFLSADAEKRNDIKKIYTPENIS